MSHLFPSPPLNPLAQAIQKALALHQQGQLDEAEKAYQRVLKTYPDQFDALHLLGMLNYQRGKLSEALRLISTAVRIAPRSADAHSNLGLVLIALKRNADALASFDKAVAIEPNNIEANNNRGRALLEAGRAQDAMACFDRVLALQPRHVEARINRGGALVRLGALDEAIGEFDKIIAAFPGHPGAHFNRGNALFALARPEEAIAAYERALGINPRNPLAWNARGVALQASKRNPEAIESFQRALALNPDYADAHFNMGLSLLTLGDYPRGFFEYEWRWTRTGMSGPRRYQKPLWDGASPLSGKTIFLHAEQGLGDTVQFARYVPLLAKTGARIVLEVQPELKSLLSGLGGAAQVLGRGEPEPAFDVHSPLGRLPLALKTLVTNVPVGIPYLRAPDDKIAAWRARLGETSAPRVAVVWAGNAAHLNDRNRSVPLPALAPLWAAGPQFISLQRELRSGDAEILAAQPSLIHLGAEIADFSDTAAVLASCDLVISVDTSVAHVAGAMGRPLWMLLPFAPDWRWTLEGTRSPWYPEARLFRQPRLGDWGSVVEAVRQELAAWRPRA